MGKKEETARKSTSKEKEDTRQHLPGRKVLHRAQLAAGLQPDPARQITEGSTHPSLSPVHIKDSER
jgi:hypothetical protein